MFFYRLIEAIDRLTREVIKLRRVIQLRKPGLVTSRMISEGVSGMSQFVLVLPTPGAPDVAEGGSRELVFSVNGGEQINQNLAGTAEESDLFEGVESQTAAGTLVDIDNAGNRSEPRTFEILLLDNQAPPQPGEVGARMVQE